MGTAYTSTVQDILDNISDFRGETSTNTDSRRIRAISRSEQAIARRTNWSINYLPDQTITSTGDTSYAIGATGYPMRNKGLVEVFIDGTLESNRYKIVTPETFKQLYNENNAEQLCYVSYDPENDDWLLNISPTPETGKVITYSYFWVPPQRTTTTDPVVCIDMEALSRLANADIYDGEDEAEKAAIERNKVEQILGGEVETEDGTSPSQTYADPGNGLGLGTY